MIKLIERFSINLLIYYLIISLLVIQFASKYGQLYAQSINECEKKIAEAEVLYNDAEFDKAISLLTQCLENNNITQEVKMEAYRLLGLNYISKDLEEQARNCVNKLLILVPNYKTNEEKDPKAFSRLVEEERKSIINNQQVQKTDINNAPQKPIEEKKEKSNSLWWYIGAGFVAVAALLIVVLGGGGGNGEKDLPEPPDLP